MKNALVFGDSIESFVKRRSKRYWIDGKGATEHKRYRTPQTPPERGAQLRAIRAIRAKNGVGRPPRVQS